MRVVDHLPQGYLGRAFGSVVEISENAAGFGWFTDATPSDDSEFSDLGLGTELVATQLAASSHNVDLLTVVIHELGHVLGLKDLSPEDSPHQIMTGVFAPGLRRLPVGETVLTDQRASEPDGILGSGEREGDSLLHEPIVMRNTNWAGLAQFLVNNGVSDGIVFSSPRRVQPHQRSLPVRTEDDNELLDCNLYSSEVERVFANSWSSRDFIVGGGMPNEDVDLLLGEDAELVIDSMGTGLAALL